MSGESTFLENTTLVLTSLGGGLVAVIMMREFHPKEMAIILTVGLLTSMFLSPWINDALLPEFARSESSQGAVAFLTGYLSMGLMRGLQTIGSKIAPALMKRLGLDVDNGKK